LHYELIKINSTDEARNVGSAFGTAAIYLNGKFISHKIDTKKSFGKLLDKCLEK